LHHRPASRSRGQASIFLRLVGFHDAAMTQVSNLRSGGKSLLYQLLAM
jgi:hypothetical protein